MRILVVRRDNIGDLICTTPLFAALRAKYPTGWIGALVNSYNAPVLAGNTDVDEVVAYTKLKHLEEGESGLLALVRRLRSLWRLRGMRLDCVALAAPDFSPRLLRIAKLLGPERVVGFSDGSSAAHALDAAVPIEAVGNMHEVERVFMLASLFDIKGPIPPLKVVVDPSQRERAFRAIAGHTGLKIAIHISARRPAQRWPAARYAALAEKLHSSLGARALLLWSPGASSDRRHPGDDEKAEEVIARAPAGSVIPYRTKSLPELVGALASCDAVVCSDGGASHLAAALQKATLCFFGDSSVERWHPWGVRHRVLRAASRRVADIEVDEAADALSALLA